MAIISEPNARANQLTTEVVWSRQINYRQSRNTRSSFVWNNVYIFIRLQQLTSNTYTCIDRSKQVSSQKEIWTKELFVERWEEEEDEEQKAKQKTQHKYVKRDDGMVAMKLQSRHDSWASAHTICKKSSTALGWIRLLSSWFSWSKSCCRAQTLELAADCRKRINWEWRTGYKLAQNAKYARDTSNTNRE